MAVGLAFEALDARAHDTLADERGGSRVVEDLGDAGPEAVNVLAVGAEDLDAVAFERLAGFVALEVRGRVAPTCKRRRQPACSRFD